MLTRSESKFREGSLRENLAKFYESDTLILILTITIICNVALTAVETDYDAEGVAEIPTWVTVCNILIFAVYLFEFVGRIYVQRYEFYKYHMNIIDSGVLLADFIGLLAGSFISSLFLILRGARLIRVSNSVTVMTYVPELGHMLRGLVGALKALAWGASLVLLILAVWAILAVRILHPLNQELTLAGVWDEHGCIRCPRAFESVPQSMLTFTQTIIAGDSWGQTAVPIVEYFPETILFFSLVLLTVQLAIINLILAVILDKANECRQKTERELLDAKVADKSKARKEFVKLCKAMDSDKSGQLTFQEISDGYENVAAFRTALQVMDIAKEDINLVFRMMDEDRSGTVAYEEFAEQLFAMKTRDIHTMMMFTSFQVGEIWHKMRRERMSKAVSAESQCTEPPNGTLQEQLEDQQSFETLRGHQGNSAWAEKLKPEKLKPELPLPAFTSEELGRLREDLERMLGSLTKKFDAHAQRLESMALLPLDTPPPALWPGSGTLLPTNGAVCSDPSRGPTADIIGVGIAGAVGAGAGVSLAGSDSARAAGNWAGGAAAHAKERALDSQSGRTRKPSRGADAPSTLICCRPTHEEVRRLR